MMTKLLFELSGEHPELPYAEIYACLSAASIKYRVIYTGPQILVVELVGINEKHRDNLYYINYLARRLALCKSIQLFIDRYDNLNELETTLATLNVYGTTYRIQATRVRVPKIEISLSQLERRLGAVVRRATGKKVDLSSPSTDIRITLSDRYYYLGIHVAAIDRKAFELRKAQYRPYTSPVSLHPRLARVLVNLSKISEGSTVLDPFCGTGGILIEAGLIGAKLIGVDIKEIMINGCKNNIEFFKLTDFKLYHADVGKIPKLLPERVDAIVTDPPYGRAATTCGETLMHLYERTFKIARHILASGSYMAIVLPSTDYIKLGEQFLQLCEMYPVYVHRSLTRHFCVYRNIE
jgi:tRNA (guanine10-N2)-dimethyltransferase